MTHLLTIDANEYDASDGSVTHRGRKVSVEAHDTHLVWFAGGKFAGRLERPHVAAVTIGSLVLSWLIEFTASGRSQSFWVKESDGRALIAAWYSV